MGDSYDSVSLIDQTASLIDKITYGDLNDGDVNNNSSIGEVVTPVVTTDSGDEIIPSELPALTSPDSNNNIAASGSSILKSAINKEDVSSTLALNIDAQSEDVFIVANS